MQKRAKTRDCAEIETMLRSRPRMELFDNASSSEEDCLYSASNGESEEEASDVNSEFKIESSDDDLEDEPPSKRGKTSKILYGENRYTWTTTALEKSERHSIDCLVTHQPAGRGAAATVTSPIEVWSLLMPDDMLNVIVTHTNAEIALKRENIEGESYTHDVDLCELKAFIGLLYFAGVHDDGHNSAIRLWGRHSSLVYRATMSYNRFMFLLLTIRFDDKTTRPERRQVDKFAPIREIWEMFLANCKKYYTPHQYCTIGEQLLSFRHRCPFRVYMRSKSDKYGMKIVMMNDARTSYMINALPYVKPVSTREASESIPNYYVRTLSEPIHGSERNITCDSRFTSIEIAQQLKTAYSLTLVGTIRKNEREIPGAFKQSSTVGSARFAYSNNQVLLSYCPEKDKIVLLLSTLHKCGKYDTHTGKPEMFHFYNSTKGGTDTFDQMCHEYSVALGTCRWPLKFFFGMLDQSGINSYILFSLNAQNEKKFRAIFLEDLAIELIKPLLQSRLSIPTFPTSVRVMIETVLEIDSTGSIDNVQERTESVVDNVQERTKTVIDNAQERIETVKLAKRVRCKFCPRGKDKKTQVVCPRCQIPRCEAHRSLLCSRCTEKI